MRPDRSGPLISNQQHELAAHMARFADSVGLGDLGERERSHMRRQETTGLDQLTDLVEHVERAPGIPSAEPRSILLRAGEVRDRHDLLWTDRELDELSQDT